MSESERLIRERIACLTELLTELDEYSTPQFAEGQRFSAGVRRLDSQDEAHAPP
jgi:hypothetical protein